MSGHSKWSKIKRQKQSDDVQRGKLFTKFGRAIVLAVREGGGITDVNTNVKLRIAVDQAKAHNMPKANIERAIERGSGKSGEGEAYEYVMYEGFGPEGAAIIIEAATDNKQRTSAQIKHVLERFGGNLGTTGSVNYLFDHQGILTVTADDLSEDDALTLALEHGALDMELDEDAYLFYTDRAQLHAVKEALEKQGLTISEAALMHRPKTTLTVDEQKRSKIQSCLEQLDDLDDVQNVFTNIR